MAIKVAVLGAGPTGLMAAGVAMEHGAKVSVFASEIPSTINGAQYLHCPPPLDVRVDSFNVNYALEGSPEDYRKKVYGDKWSGSVSPEEIETLHKGWNIRQAHDELVRIIPVNIIDPIQGYVDMASKIKIEQYDLVFSSLPRKIWKTQGEVFEVQKAWALSGSAAQSFVGPNNTVLCNGSDSPSWYRAAMIDGYATVEWPWRDGKKPPIPEVVKIRKPLVYFPNQSQKNPVDDVVIHIGRYGQWLKGVLVSDAMDKVRRTVIIAGQRGIR